MDLFRHSTQLGQHQQGSLGYAHWVCHMLLNSDAHDKIVEYNIYNMHAIPVASDAITWYNGKLFCCLNQFIIWQWLKDNLRINWI